jgi:hypothetical protein
MSSRPDRSAPFAALVVLAVLGSLDWIAYLALRSAGPVVCAATVSALTTLALALGRACVRLLGSGWDEDPPR